MSSSNTPHIPRTNRVILIRHASSEVDSARNAREWILSDAGREAARRLTALGLFDLAGAYYAGDEPKMRETLEPVAAAHGFEVIAEPDLSESRSKGWVGDREAFEQTIRQFFEAPAEPPAPGWETAETARARFERAIERLCAKHDPVVFPGHALPGTFAVCSGGRAITAYVAGLFDYTAAQAFAFWQSLRMPDVAVVELPEGAGARAVIPFGTLVV